MSGPTSGLPWDDLILVGIVARPHGTKGDVIVTPHSDFVEERFVEGATFHLKSGNAPARQIEIGSVRFQQGRPVIRFEGVSSMTDAEALRDAELRIDPVDQGPLPEGSFYHHQLIGCLVTTADGEEIGRVVGIEGDMARSRLVVEGPRRRVEIPLADELCSVDVGKRQITATLPEGLLEL